VDAEVWVRELIQSSDFNKWDRARASMEAYAAARGIDLDRLYAPDVLAAVYGASGAPALAEVLARARFGEVLHDEAGERIGVMTNGEAVWD
jgi:hypothetical protein